VLQLQHSALDKFTVYVSLTDLFTYRLVFI